MPICSVSHCQELQPPNSNESVAIEENTSTREELEKKYQDPSFELSPELYLLTQADLNDLVSDFNLSKKQAQFLGSLLKGWNLLLKAPKCSFFFEKVRKILRIFIPRKKINVTELLRSAEMYALGYNHKP